MKAISSLYKVKLKVVSPTHIGAGDAKTLSPYSDYVLSDDASQVLLIKPGKLKAFLLDHPNFWSGLQLIDGENKSYFDLKEKLIEKGFDLEAGTIALPQFGMETGKHLEVLAQEKSAGRPYLPGSSLKGAVRTAILFDWLINGRNSPWAKEKIPGHYTSLPKFNEEELFGKAWNAPLSRAFQFSDSNLLATSEIAIWAMERIRLAPSEKAKSNIPLIREAFFPETQLESSLNLHPRQIPFNSHLYYFKEGAGALTRRIHNFSRAIVQREIEMLEKAHFMPNSEARASLKSFYLKLEEEMRAGKTFIRLGGGKTYFDNAIALAILELPMNTRRKEKFFSNFIKRHTGSNGQEDIWPITRTVAWQGNTCYPPGWVEWEVQTQ